MDRFRLKGTDVVKHAEPGTTRHRIYSRSGRYEVVGERGEIGGVDPGQLETLTNDRLHEIASTIGVSVPAKATKAELIDAIRKDRD